jgi:hypothetical protein
MIRRGDGLHRDVAWDSGMWCGGVRKDWSGSEVK